MSVRGLCSEGNSIQSMTTKEICILVAIDDLTWNNIVSRMLQFCTYEVLDTGKADDVLEAIWERKEHVNVVFTNVHRLSSEGFEILQNIKNRLNLQTIVMSPDDEKVAISEKGSSFVAYIVKFLNVNDINNLWKSALEIENLENSEKKQGGKLKSSGTIECNTRTASIDEVSRSHRKRGREESLEEDESHRKRHREESLEEDEEYTDGQAEKKTRMVWTKEMHQKFIEAIEILGYEKAFPKKIVEVMEVPGLTRENVASHLQKYRMCIKRAQESDPNSLHGMNLTTAVQNQCLSLGVSPLLSEFSYGNSYLRRNLYGAYVHPPSRRTFPNVLYPSATMYPKSNQMDIRNSQWINGSGIMNSQYGYGPNIMLKSNFRVYNDPKKNVLMNIGGRSSLDANRPSTTDPSTSFLGFRLTEDGKSVEAGGKCISTSTKTKESETLPPTLADGNTSQLSSTLNESENSLISVEDYGYSDESLMQPPPLSENCILGQNPFSEQSPILENGLLNLYSPTLQENEYRNRYSPSLLDSVAQEQSFPQFYQAAGGISEVISSTTDDTISQQQVFTPLCQSFGDTLAAQCSMPMDPILQQPPSPPLYEVLGIESSPQSSTISENFIQQYQHSVPPVPTTQESFLPSTLDELEGILSGIGDDFWNNDIEDIINTINS